MNTRDSSPEGWPTPYWPKLIYSGFGLVILALIIATLASLEDDPVRLLCGLLVLTGQVLLIPGLIGWGIHASGLSPGIAPRSYQSLVASPLAGPSPAVIDEAADAANSYYVQRVLDGILTRVPRSSDRDAWVRGEINKFAAAGRLSPAQRAEALRLQDRIQAEN